MLVGFSSRTRFAGFEVVSFSKAIMVLVSRRNRVTVTVRQVQDAPVALASLAAERNHRRAFMQSRPTNANRRESGSRITVLR